MGYKLPEQSPTLLLRQLLQTLQYTHFSSFTSCVLHPCNCNCHASVPSQLESFNLVSLLILINNLLTCTYISRGLSNTTHLTVKCLYTALNCFPLFLVSPAPLIYRTVPRGRKPYNSKHFSPMPSSYFPPTTPSCLASISSALSSSLFF